MMLTEDEIPEDLIKEARIFHFGTLSMTHEGVRKATKKAIAIAKDAGALVSFDPNLREPLWNSLEEAKEQVLYGLGQCDVLKISDNEIQWLTGEDDYTEGVKWIRDRYDIALILVSMGKDGAGHINLVRDGEWKSGGPVMVASKSHPERQYDNGVTVIMGKVTSAAKRIGKGSGTPYFSMNIVTADHTQHHISVFNHDDDYNRNNIEEAMKRVQPFLENGEHGFIPFITISSRTLRHRKHRQSRLLRT